MHQNDYTVSPQATLTKVPTTTTHTRTCTYPPSLPYTHTHTHTRLHKVISLHTKKENMRKTYLFRFFFCNRQGETDMYLNKFTNTRSPKQIIYESGLKLNGHHHANFERSCVQSLRNVITCWNFRQGQLAEQHWNITFFFFLLLLLLIQGLYL